MSLFVHFFKILSLYLEARIWIRILIKVTSRIRIRINVIRIRNTVYKIHSQIQKGLEQRYGTAKICLVENVTLTLTNRIQ
jgi:hypothetical protein